MRSLLRRARRGHSLADPDELRCPHERSAFAVRDPVKHFEQYMLDMGYANKDLFELTRKKVGENTLKTRLKYAFTQCFPYLGRRKSYSGLLTCGYKAEALGGLLG